MLASHISLFAGVGMTDLAAERLGYKTVATAEIDTWCRQLLAKRFPGALHFPNVTSIRRDLLRAYAPGGQLRGPLLISGGFPCQGMSAIGNAQGFKDPRSGLWQEFDRVIGEFQPDVVLIENSPMLRTRGLHRVLSDLHDRDYNCRWDCVPAASVGAPHTRDRIFIVAWPNGGAKVDYRTLDYFGVAVTAGVLSLKWLNHTHTGDGEAPEKFVTRFPRAGEMKSGFVSKREPQATIKAAREACLSHAVPCPATNTGAWPTPLSTDFRRDNNSIAEKNRKSPSLPAMVRMYPTPRRAPNDWRTTRNAPTHGVSHGKTLAGELNDLERAEGRTPAKSSESAGNINPVWVEWLMGLPLGWTNPDTPNQDLVPHPGWQQEPPGVPRTIHPQPHRSARLSALGNGLVPQVAVAAMNILYR